MQKKYNIVMFGMNPYTDWLKGFNTRNLQVLDHLQMFDQVEKILYVDFLPFTWKRSLRHYVENILFGIKARGTLFGDLTSRCTQVSSKIVVYSTIDSIFKEKTVIKEVETVIKRLGFQKYLLWSNNPMFVSAYEKLDAWLKLFDTIDNWLEHPSYKKYKKRLKRNYRLISKKADLIFTVADELKNFYRELDRKKDVHFIANGVDLERFSEPNLKAPENFMGLKKPIITYIGSIQNRLDLEILEYIYKHNQDKTFVMIGPTWPVYLKKIRKKSTEAKLMEKYQNVHYLGRKPYSEIAGYIAHSDLLIIPHKEDEFLKYTSPTKLFQFLAQGKPVVTTRGAGVAHFADLVYIASDKDDFNNKIKKALIEASTSQLEEERKKAVFGHTWYNRVKHMLEIIERKVV